MTKTMLLGLGIAVAALVNVEPAAAYEAEDTNGIVDWDDAALYAELMDTFVGDGDTLMAVYIDDAQNLLWSQPASMTVEDATAALEAGAEYAATLLVTQYITPTSLWLCHKDKNDDTNCADGHKWSGGDFSYWDINGNIVRYKALDPDCLYEDVERVRATGNSNLVDYCGSDYQGQVYDIVSNWFAAEEDGCSGLGGLYSYYLDDSATVDDYSYDTSEGEVAVARFRFHIPGTRYFYSEIWFERCY